MKQLLSKCEQYLNMLPAKVRLFPFLILVLLIIFLWNTTLWQPLQDRKEELTKKIANETKVITSMQTELQLIKASKLAQGVEKNQPQMGNAIPVQKIPDFLEQLVNARNDLALISLQTMPTKPLTTADAVNILLEHDFIIKFNGTYFATLAYLKSLEKLNLPLSWDKLDYKVITYPQAEITLQLHALSNEKNRSAQQIQPNGDKKLNV